MKNKRQQHGLSNHKLYSVWKDIKRRTKNKNRKDYDRYGGRGISICTEWELDFLSFYNWSNMNGYSEGLSIDRIDNDGDYEPSNCRWVDGKTQSQNTRLLRSTNTTGYRGVSPRGKRFISQIHHNGKKHIGIFNTSKDAAIAYNKYVVKNNLKHPLNTIKEY